MKEYQILMRGGWYYVSQFVFDAVPNQRRWRYVEGNDTEWHYENIIEGGAGE